MMHAAPWAVLAVPQWAVLAAPQWTVPAAPQWAVPAAPQGTVSVDSPSLIARGQSNTLPSFPVPEKLTFQEVS